MLYIPTFQESPKSVSQGVQLILPGHSHWLPGFRIVSTDVEDWSSFTVDLGESLESIPIWQKIVPSTVYLSQIEIQWLKHQIEIQWLERLYVFRNRAEVIWFLEKYPFLVSLLLEAYDKIGKYFPHSPLFLEVFTDSEAVNESQLVIFIATNLTPDKAVERLDQLDEDWWLDALEQSQGKLCINLEFR